MKSRKFPNIEAEFNAGVTYAETVAVFFRELSRIIIDLKRYPSVEGVKHSVAILFEIWQYIHPYRSREQEMEDVKKKLDAFEKKIMFPQKVERKDLLEMISMIGEIKQVLHTHTVFSGLLPFRKRLSDTFKLKSAILEG